MAHHRAVAGAGEAPVGDQRHVVAQALADDGGGYRQHLLHSRAALGAFVADDYYVSGLDLAALDGPEGGSLLVEYAGGATVHLLLVAGHLDDRAVRGQVAAQDGQAARRAARRVNLRDYGLVVHHGYAFQVLGHGLAGDRHGVPVEQARVEQPLHHQRDAAVAGQVGHHVAARGLHVGDVGGAGADALEVLQAQRHPGLVGDGQQVQDDVGGAAHGDAHGDGVLESLLGHDVAGAHVLFQQPQHGASRVAGLAQLARVNGGQRGVAGQGHSHHLDGGGHGIGGEQAAAGTLSGTGDAFQFP